MYPTRAFRIAVFGRPPYLRILSSVRKSPRNAFGVGTIAVALLLVVCGDSIEAAEQPKSGAQAGRVFILDWSDLERAKQSLRTSPELIPALKKLQRDADGALAGGNYSVTDKTIAPPSGNKHDYMSLAPYWWPNPDTPNGLPYIRRDGEINPERDHASDRKRLDAMVHAVTTLASAYFFTGTDKYADRAVKLLRFWFFDPASKMTPRLEYAQAVPGRSQGGAAGIIETHDLPYLLDAVALLSHSPLWTKTDHKQLQAWFGAYLEWLRKSPQGRDEAEAKNNHGTWYDVQIASYALFTAQDQLAKSVLTQFRAKRIDKQIEPEGRQPRELARAQPWHYSVFNLEAMLNAAAIAGTIGVDPSSFDKGPGDIRAAMNWLAPFATGEKKWQSGQSSNLRPERLAPLLRRSALRYREPGYEQAVAKLPKITGDERWQLLYPKLEIPNSE
jgi:hypothetical protein